MLGSADDTEAAAKARQEAIDEQERILEATRKQPEEPQPEQEPEPELEEGVPGDVDDNP